MTVKPEKPGFTLPAYPTAFEPKPKKSFEGQKDEFWQVAAETRNGELKVCQAQLGHASKWYKGLRTAISRKEKPLTGKGKRRRVNYSGQ